MIIIFLLLDIGKVWQLHLINETKLDGTIDDALVGIDGYSIKRRDRNRNGGGVAIYIKDSIVDKCSIRVDLPESSLESLCLEVLPFRAAPFLVFAWYRPPRGATH